MHVANPWKSYRQIATQTAPPGQLVLMLYEGAIRFLERGLAGFELEDPAQLNMAVHNNLQRAVDIIRELNLSLNMEQGGEFATTLRRLYEYFDRRIWESNMQKRPDGVQEVIRHITVLRDAWAAMLSGNNHTELTSPQLAEMALAPA
ncbi:MAG TPA: flagellar export chaperone FliS [Verrucomicrobiae bacterium]|nr:flagellar export chaperone FliS [Verrucomicrobiae bacterium]